VTHGFIKKTQKTPKEEILKAKKLRNEFYKRIEKGEITI
jgi:phage-related protein